MGSRREVPTCADRLHKLWQTHVTVALEPHGWSAWPHSSQYSNGTSASSSLDPESHNGRLGLSTHRAPRTKQALAPTKIAAPHRSDSSRTYAEGWSSTSRRPANGSAPGSTPSGAGPRRVEMTTRVAGQANNNAKGRVMSESSLMVIRTLSRCRRHRSRELLCSHA